MEFARISSSHGFYDYQEIWEDPSCDIEQASLTMSHPIEQNATGGRASGSLDNLTFAT
jgi:S-adenosylmethionine:diacylglycerol 3-amino-3-carboxypropyl transferase